LNVNLRFGGTYRLHLQGGGISLARDQRESRWQAELCFTLVSCLAYFPTLKIEEIYFSETSVDIQRTTRCHIPEVGTLRNPRCENLKSYIHCILFSPFETVMDLFISIALTVGKNIFPTRKRTPWNRAYFQVFH
jgi:hypothetical protein